MTDRERLLEILNKPIFPHEMVDPLEAVADYLLHNGVTIQKWIPVTERLPENEGWYMVYTKNKGDHARKINKAQYYHHSWHGNGGRWDNVTHWMPLPEPPKED